MNLNPSRLLKQSTENSKAMLLFYGLRIGWRVFMRRSVLSHASVCGYSTILALIPILIISISILEVFSGPDKDQIFDFVIEYFLPGAINEDVLENPSSENSGGLSPGNLTLSEQWIDFKRNLIDIIQGAANLRIISAVFLIVACVGLFNSIEYAFNEIWMVRKRRTLFKQFLAFWLLLTMTPILLGLSAYFTIQLKAYAAVDDVKLYEFILNYIISFLFTFLAFLFANRYMPNIPVRLYPAMMGSFISAFMWETAKHAFGLYMNYSINLDHGFYTIYSGILAIPVFIIWLYYSYLCFLLGPVIATTIQDYDLQLVRLNFKRERKDHLPLYTFRVFFLICSHFHFQKSGISFDELEKATGWNVLRLRECITELKRIELIHADQSKRLYFPNADPSMMSLRESLESILGLRHPNMEQIKQEEDWIEDVERCLASKPEVTVMDMIEEEVNGVNPNGKQVGMASANPVMNRE